MYFPGPKLTLLVTTSARYRVPGMSTRHGADIGLVQSVTSNEISPAAARKARLKVLKRERSGTDILLLTASS